MASVAPPKPGYPPYLSAAVIADGLLSAAQLESVIYAGEAHAGYLAGSWIVDETFDVVSAAPTPAPAKAGEAETAMRFRRGWFLGDGTGAGKGRQVAGILLDNWVKGRRRAVWVSKSDKLIADAQRDWSALGQERLLITPLARFRQGTPIRLDEGILFTTYATLRSDAREEKASRVRQIIDWLGPDFDGVVVFDESHALQNAAAARANAATRRPPSRDERASCACSTPYRMPACLRLRDRRDHGRQSRLCPAARLVGRRGFPLHHPCRVRRSDRGRRRRGDGSARPSPARPGR